jgi:hypothetical protein
MQRCGGGQQRPRIDSPQDLHGLRGATFTQGLGAIIELAGKGSVGHSQIDEVCRVDASRTSRPTGFQWVRSYGRRAGRMSSRSPP